MTTEKHIPTINQLAARVVDATMDAARATESELAYSYRDYAIKNLVDLIRAVVRDMKQEIIEP